MTKISRFLRDQIGISPNKKLVLYDYILLFAPTAIWFSYWPQISLGSDATTNFKITVAMVYCVVLAVASLSRIVKNFREIFVKNHVTIWLVSAFVFYNFLSIIWSENRLRTLLTAGVIFALYLIFLGFFATKDFAKKYVKPLAKIYIFSAVIMSIFAVAQFIYGTFLAHGFLLCAGCVAGQFGFVRPNVFAIEPQFFGNLLLVPLLIIFREILTQKNRISRDVLFGFLLLTLFLTLSRGAIFAFIFGAILVIVFSRKNGQTSWKKFFGSLGIGAAGLVICLLLQGTSAILNPNTNTSFGAAINSSLNQLSLGLIKIQDVAKVSSNNSNDQKTHSISHQPAFSGYVAESTNVRTSLSRTAIETWMHESFSRKVFGVGLGGSGVAMANFLHDGDAKQIVQNEYVEVLLELGVVGFAIFAAILVGLIREIRRSNGARWTLGIMAAFALQWLFFSGYPSALHIYLVLIILLLFAKNGNFIPRHAASRPAK